MKTTRILIGIFIIAAVFISGSAGYADYAIEQTNYGGGYTNNDIIIGQSFTTAEAGKITSFEIDIYSSDDNVCPSVSEANVRIYIGDQSPNTPKSALYVFSHLIVVKPHSDNINVLKLPVPLPVNANTQYTVEIQGGMCLALGAGGYPGGGWWVDGNKVSGRDLYFKVNIKTKTVLSAI
jgi:hypothetical protein